MTDYYYVFQKLRAKDLNNLVAVTVEAKDSSVTDGSTASAAFTNTLTTTGILGISFTAGITGTVEVKWMMNTRNATAGQEAQSSFEIRAGSTVGSGSVVWNADANTAAVSLSVTANAGFAATGFGTVTGLTAGTVYNACIVYRTGGGGTAFYNRRRISVTTA